MVIFTQEQENSNEPFGKWVAVDKNSGEVRWSIAHLPHGKASYLVPCVYTDGAGKDVIVFCSNQRGVCGVDPSSGKIVWQVKGVTPARPIAGPVISGDLILNTSGGGGSGKGLSVVRPGSDGKVETVYTLQERFIPYVSTPIAVDGLFFFYHDNGNIACIDSLTGKLKWSEKPAGRFYSSPVYADGKLYCIDMKGKLIVLAAGEKFKLLGESDLGDKSYSSVAMSNGRFFLRTFTRLICVGK
jgi:outer membrane protein assembly factor BamB